MIIYLGNCSIDCPFINKNKAILVKESPYFFVKKPFTEYFLLFTDKLFFSFFTTRLLFYTIHLIQQTIRPFFSKVTKIHLTDFSKFHSKNNRYL